MIDKSLAVSVFDKLQQLGKNYDIEYIYSGEFSSYYIVNYVKSFFFFKKKHIVAAFVNNDLLFLGSNYINLKDDLRPFFKRISVILPIDDLVRHN